MRVLLIDIASHLQTKSVDFFIDILREARFEVQTHHYSGLYHANIPQEKIEEDCNIGKFLAKRPMRSMLKCETVDICRKRNILR